MVMHAIVPDTTIEDLEFITHHGGGLTEAAHRTGFTTAAALEKWLYRHGQRDLIARLNANDPAPTWVQPRQRCG
jgi:hypothetical protein